MVINECVMVQTEENGERLPLRKNEYLANIDGRRERAAVAKQYKRYCAVLDAAALGEGRRVLYWTEWSVPGVGTLFRSNEWTEYQVYEAVLRSEAARGENDAI